MASKIRKFQDTQRAKFQAQVSAAEKEAEYAKIQAEWEAMDAEGWYWDYAREDFDIAEDGSLCHDGWYSVWVLTITCEGYTDCEIEAYDYKDAHSERKQNQIKRALRRKHMIESGVLTPSNPTWWHDPISSNYFLQLQKEGKL